MRSKSHEYPHTWGSHCSGDRRRGKPAPDDGTVQEWGPRIRYLREDIDEQYTEEDYQAISELFVFEAFDSREAEEVSRAGDIDYITYGLEERSSTSTSTIPWEVFLLRRFVLQLGPHGVPGTLDLLRRRPGGCLSRRITRTGR